MNAQGGVILGVASFCLLVGLSLYALIWKQRDKLERIYVVNNISWVLIALFPALVIFSLFPQSQISGSILGFSATGSVALFIFIWWYGTRNSWKAIKLDELHDRIQALKEDLRKSQELAAMSQGEVTPKVFTETKVYAYPLKRKKKRKIGFITGNIQGITNVDIWVNSENTNMQMARFYERSISGTIRYLGARKDVAGDVVEDTIMAEIQEKMKGKSSVQPGTVLVTTSGELQKSHNVKNIFHVASVRGQVAAGYQPIENLEICIRNALHCVGPDHVGDNECKSILFPLLGTGTAKAGTEQVATRLLTAALEYLEATEKTSVDAVYFLTWTDRELAICTDILKASGRVEIP